MHHFRKKSPSSNTPANRRPSSPTPPMVEYIKQELATFHPRIKDQRALAASSSAIALSIASPSCDPTDITLDEPGSSKESSWRTAYGAARMAVEITNASSDMLPPLKAVAGALSVLIKNYDQTTANAEQIGEIERRVESLGEVVASPVGNRDSEEKARREALRKQLVRIIAKLKPLSEQHGIVRFLKNNDHSKILNGFVQDLAYAVTDYQTSLQQSIHKDTKRIDETTKRIDETTKKIDMSAKSIIEAADLELLAKLEPVRNAGYQAGHHDTCLRGTRESVLDGIIQWANDTQDRHVFWLNGLAGTGKSTIAQTFSETIAKTGILGASFFCSRDYLDRKELKNIFPTLAYQLACLYPTFRTHVIRVIKRDPSVAQNSLISQLKDLIVDPLSSTHISCVIVIDALDECVDDQPASAILSVLGRHAKELSFAKFFITGRPEPRIRTGFRLPLLEPLTQILLLHEVKPSNVDGDIQLYLNEKLTAVAKRRSDFDVSDPWPCDKDLVTLTKKSSGLFIFASTLARFIESEHHEPNERLQLIITPSDSTFHEGRAGIDPLYIQVLTLAFSDAKEAMVFTNLRRVLGAVILAFNPLSREQIGKILDINPSLITITLRHLHSVLLVPSEDSKEIRIFHKSFPDFLQDRERCSDSKFFIGSAVHHGDIALGCLELLKKLKPNPCDLPDFAMNRDVVNLPELLEKEVGSATRYACGHWAMHIRSSPTTNDYAIQLIPSAAEFLTNNAVPWIEVMSLENRLESVIHSIYNLLDWIGMVDVPVSHLRSVAEDCLRFTMHFFQSIQQSAPHIYHSALPLSPSSSTFHSKTLSEKTRITEFHGRPDAWGVVVRTVTVSSDNFTCMATFGNKIAAACDDGPVGIYDSVTGVLRLSLSLTDPVQSIRGSPDGSMLFCAHKTPSVTVWDIQTGGLIHTFGLARNAQDIAVSSEGRYLACGLSDGSFEVRAVANAAEGGAIWTSPLVTHFCWLEPEERLAVSTRALVRIWDIVAGTLLHSFTIRYPVDHMAYSLKFDRLAIMASSTPENAITIVNPQTGTSTTSHWIHQQFSCFAFSQTAEALVCGVETHGLQVFDLSTQRLKHFEYPDTMKSVSCLQNGTIVANFIGSGIQLLSLDWENALSQQQTIPALTTRASDGGRIIVVLLTSRDHIVLLEQTTMSQLLKIPVRDTRPNPADISTILCASHKNRVVVYYFEKGNTRYLQLWKFHEEVPRWTVEVEQEPKICQISPTAVRLVTTDDTVNRQARIRAWNAQNGQLNRKARGHLGHPGHPEEIEFISDDQFILHFKKDSLLYVVGPRTLEMRGGGDLFTRPEWRRSTRQPLDVDGTHQWVVSGGKKICWIPPGYIGSVQPSFVWVGNYTLIMAGKDGTLRKLTFSKSS